MGKIMSVMQRSVKRSLNNFNIDNRAQRVISKEKPTPAPLHESAAKQLKIMQEKYPDFLKQHYTKDKTLDDRLKQVYVLSKDAPESNLIKPNPSRPLPQNRSSVSLPDYGFEQPDVVPPGKINLKNALQLISDHQNDTVKYNPEKLALDYNLEPQIVNSLIKYFQTFDVYLPQQKPPEKFPDKITKMIQEETIKKLK